MIEGTDHDNPHNTDRFHAWYDQLTGPERAEVNYITQELKGDFAAAYLAVNMNRLGTTLGNRMYALENRSPFRVGVREIVAAAGAVLAALGLQHSNVDLPR